MKHIDIAGVGTGSGPHSRGPAERAPLVFLHEGLGSVAMWQQRGRHWPSRALRGHRARRLAVLAPRLRPVRPVADVRGPSRGKAHGTSAATSPTTCTTKPGRSLPALCCTPWACPTRARRPLRRRHHRPAARQPPPSRRLRGHGAPRVHRRHRTQAIAQRPRPCTKATPTGCASACLRYHADVDNAFWQWNDVWLSTSFQAHFDIRSRMRIHHGSAAPGARPGRRIRHAGPAGRNHAQAPHAQRGSSCRTAVTAPTAISPKP